MLVWLVAGAGSAWAASVFTQVSGSPFSVAPGGTLTPVAGSPFAAGTGSLPNSVAFSSDGGLLAIADDNHKAVPVFSVGSDGTLTPVTGSPFATGGGDSVSVAFSASGG